METKRQNYAPLNVQVYDLAEEDVVTVSELGGKTIDPWDTWEAGLLQE